MDSTQEALCLGLKCLWMPFGLLYVIVTAWDLYGRFMAYMQKRQEQAAALGSDPHPEFNRKRKRKGKHEMMYQIDVQYSHGEQDMSIKIDEDTARTIFDDACANQDVSGARFAIINTQGKVEKVIAEFGMR